MRSNPVQVTIIDDPLLKQDCDMSCGTDWSSLQMLDLARKQITGKYGTNVQLTYMDMTGDDTDRDIDKWMDSIKKQNVVVPLLVINGQVRISGNFDIRQMMDAIEVEMEMGA